MANQNLNKNLLQTWREHHAENNIQPQISAPDISFEQLTMEQQRLVKFVETRLNKPQDEQYENPVRLILLSPPGTGKTTTLAHIKFLLETKKRSDPDFDFKFAVLTGTLAFQLKIQTIHSAFKLPVKFSQGFLENIKNGSAYSASILPEFRKVRWVILDEMSLISLRLLNAIDLIMRSCEEFFKDEPFASRSLVICGDPLQPLTVADHAVFYPAYQLDRHHFYETSRAQQRQFGDCENQKVFRNFLVRLRFDCTLPEDIEYLRSRQQTNLSAHEQQEFRQALHVFSLKCDVRAHNMKILRQEFGENEIISISNGIQPLHLAISAPVFITKNIITELGVTNGSRGHVRDIIFEDEDAPPNLQGLLSARQVKCIIVEIVGYTGPTCTTARGQGFPIFKYNETVYCHTATEYVQVKAFPLEIGYATTMHKVQGLSLTKLAVHLGVKELWTKMDYLCLSRVQRWDQIMFTDSHIANDRLTKKSDEVLQASKLQKFEMARLRKLWTTRNAKALK